MAKEICISTTPHETRLAILEDDQLAEIYYERENEYTLAGSIYKGRVTRVLPGMQSSFVDVGLERDAFLYVTDFLEEQEDSEDYETAGSGGQARKPVEEAIPAAAAPEERRGRREGRGRGEGRRPERAEAAPAAPAAAPVREERAPVVAAFKRAEPTEADREEKGDGDGDAPEGTRRWRGRRGRRRGGMRAGVLGASLNTPEGGEEALAATQTAAAPFSLPEHGAPGGMAAPLRGPEPDEPEGQGGADTIELQAAAAGYDRGAWDRNVSREQPLRARREPPAARPEPVAAVLPGESLSKYGGSAAAAEPARTSVPVQRLAPRRRWRPWKAGTAVPCSPVNRCGATRPAPRLKPKRFSIRRFQPSPFSRRKVKGWPARLQSSRLQSNRLGQTRLGQTRLG